MIKIVSVDNMARRKGVWNFKEFSLDLWFIFMHFKPFYYMDAFMLRALRPQKPPSKFVGVEFLGVFCFGANFLHFLGCAVSFPVTIYFV